MVRQMEQLLLEMGWTDGFHVPVANEENKRIEAEVEAKMKLKAKYTIQLEELTERLDALNRHMKSVQLEHQQNQSLITAHRMQLQTEDHMHRLALAERSSVKQELQQLNKAFMDLGDRHNLLQNDIFRHTESLERLKATVKCDKDALTAWEEELTRSDENNELLQQFFYEDESKWKEMELKRQRLQMECESRKRHLQKVVGEVEVLEVVLDQTARTFREVHRQRQEEIRQWEESVRMLHQRERDINKMLEAVADARARNREKQELRDEAKRFYDNEVNNTSEMETELKEEELRIRKQTEMNKLLDKAVDELKNELMAIQRSLVVSNKKLEEQRLNNKHIKQEIVSKELRLVEMREINETLKKKLEEAENNLMTAAERSKQIQDMIEAEEHLMQILLRDLEKVQHLSFRAQQEMFDLNKKEELQEVDLKSMKLSSARLEKQAQHLEDEIQRQKEIMYMLDFETQRLESRIAHMSGDRGIEAREENEKKLVELEQILKEKTATCNLLTAQVQRLEDTMRKLSTALDADSAELKRLESRRQDQMLLVDGGQKQLENSRRINLERQVEENVLKLRVKQLEQAMTKEGDHVYTLEKQRLELEAAMKERQVEISVHTDMLKAQKRALNEEKSRLNREIMERRIKISQLQKKHDIAVSSLGTDEDGEQVSISHIKIKSAQEKYMLQEQGDELDTKIRRTEKEILAMENTLKVVNAANDTYRKNLATVDQNSPEFQEKKELETEYYKAIDQLRNRRSVLSNLKSETEKLDHTLEELKITENEIQATWRDREQQGNELDRDMKEQQVKLKRAETQLRKIIKELHGTTEPRQLCIDEKDINLRELFEQNGSALQQLAELVARYIETGPVVVRYLHEKGLKLPATKSSLSVLSSRSRGSFIPTSSASSSKVSVVQEGSSSVVNIPSVITIDPLTLEAASSRSRSSVSSDSSRNAKTKKK
ncbi:coiled-coil domain-containing protein 39 [Anabrus simplex]|uniref:coiled-coil domain-containing protein 39 n=1 Tax=Anabrus simplex TaxID=316456 RepID=UPI0035A3172D